MTQQRKSTEERRREVADVALEIIAEEGLRRFTVANISERVGLAEGTIFRHFDDVDDIVLESVDRLRELLIEEAGGFDGGGDDPLERIEHFLCARIELISKRPELLKLLFSEDLAKIGPEAAAQQVRTLKRRSLTFLFEQLRRAEREGRLSTEIEPEDLLFTLHGTALASVFSGEDVESVVGESIEPARAVRSLLRIVES